MTTETPLFEAIKSLKIAEGDLKSQLRSIQDAIAALDRNSRPHVNLDDTKKNEYDSDWSISNKFLYLLKRYNRFIHFREAAEILVDIDGEGDAKELTGKLSSGTISLKQNGIIVKYQASKSNQDTFWGSPKWLDENGKIKSGFEFNKDYLSDGNKKSPLFDL